MASKMTCSHHHLTESLPAAATCQVEPTNVAQTVSILRGLRSRYEAHHGVKIADSALQAAASMSDRWGATLRLTGAGLQALLGPYLRA